MKLPIVWVSNIKDRDQQKSQLVTYQTVLEGDKTFKRLRELIKEEIATLDKNTDYSNPAWAYKQAHNNGLKEGLTKVLTLIGDQS